MRNLRAALLLVLAAFPAQGLDCAGPYYQGEDFALELVGVVIDGAPSDDRSQYEGARFGIWNEVSYGSGSRTVVFSGFRDVNPKQSSYQSEEYLEYYPVPE